MTSTTAWLLGLFSLALIALAQSIPVEIVYTGEAGCDCPTKLDYQLNVPKPPKCKKHSVNEYGYKVVEPVAAKAKVSYSFDFTVEEPKTPAPPKTKKWDLYAKVDRIAVNKGDCGEPESSCTCGQCGITKPQYRYVYKRLKKPCSCQKPNCTCDQRRNFVVEAIQVPANADGGFDGDGADDLRRPGNNIRRKRDLNESAFRPRKGDGGRLVKLYQKNINEKAKSLFGWPDFKKPLLANSKKTLFGRLVKRDIKGEYDLIEDERKKLDLTVPEIIQYMPETLRPNFKRNAKCYFGCDKAKASKEEEEKNEEPKNIEASEEQQLADEEDKPFKASLSLKKLPKYYKKYGANALGPDPAAVSTSGDSTYTKRQAAQYNYQVTSSCPTAQSQSASPASSPANSPASATYAANAAVPLFQANSAYAAKSAYSSPQKQQYGQQQQYTRLAQKSTNPIQLLVGGHRPQKTSYSAVNEATANGGAGVLSPDYLYDQLGQKYVERDCNGCVRVIAATPTVPDPNAGVAPVSAGLPMSYAGDLDTPLQRYKALLRESQQRGGPYDQESVSSHQYPVQHISNDQLDKIIAEIVYRHPDFIEATAHEEGALVDPEPWQEEETKDFIKKLLDGRLDLWFGGHEEYVNVQQRPGGSYDAKYYYHYAQNRPKERQSSSQQYQQQPQTYQQQPQTYQQPQNEKQSQPQQYAPPQQQKYEQPQPQKSHYEQPHQKYTPQQYTKPQQNTQPQQYTPQQNTQPQEYTPQQQNTQQQQYTQQNTQPQQYTQQNTQPQQYTQPQQNTQPQQYTQPQQQPQQYPQAKRRNTYNIYSRKIVGSCSDEY